MYVLQLLDIEQNYAISICLESFGSDNGPFFKTKVQSLSVYLGFPIYSLQISCFS